MKKWPVLVINIPKAYERKLHMKKSFLYESIIWINGVNSFEWRSDDLDFKKTKIEIINKLVLSEILHRECLTKNVVYPGEIGCALGHKNAWEWIVQNLKKDNEYAIVLEDDIEPTENYIKNIQKSVEKQGGLHKDAEVTFLSHNTGFDMDFKKFDKEGRLVSGTGNYGYVISKNGAKNAINMQFPMKEACDIQWRDTNTMFVVKEPIVKMSSIGRFSNIRGRCF